MRVISGLAKGFNLFSPNGSDVRPTADRTKEALFSMLSPYLYEADFLDLFSGTGAIGIEALSRGAKRAVFVDNSRHSTEYIKRNLEHTKLSHKAEIVQEDVYGFLKKRREAFDLIFLDPPYNKDLINPALRLIYEYNALNPGGLCAAEYSAHDKPDAPYFDIYKNKRYSNINIVIYTLPGN